MDFTIPEDTRQIQQNVRSWAAAHASWRVDNHLFDRDRWQELVELGVLSVEREGGTALDTVVALIELGPAGMPGPVVEAYLAGVAGHDASVAEVVTAVWGGSPAARAGEVLVGWGAIADTVVDAGSGEVVARGPLPEVKLTYPLPHGRLTAASLAAQGDATRRWLAGAAVIAGLADAAVGHAVEHAKARRQFGKPLGAFQAVQTRLVDSALAVRTLRTAVLDAASRLAGEQPQADVAAAIAWIAAFRASRLVEKNCQQVLGATGFALETGFVGLTWPMWWVRESIGRADATALLRSRLIRGEHRPTLVREFFAA
jgi:alkylation response protein AidB-like acyl-CoA dehydrogenase